MSISETKKWAKAKIKGNIWNILPAMIVAGIITNFTLGNTHVTSRGIEGSTYQLGWLFYFVEVGLTYFMIKFITDQKYEFNDLFHFAKDFGRCLGANLLSGLFIFLWGLLLIVPGIIKAYSYALLPYLLADERYRNLKVTELLKKSEEMMKGHRMDLFLLRLSFIGWHMLSVLTLCILEIWVAPYQKTATVKFLNDIKASYDGNAQPVAEQGVNQQMPQASGAASTEALTANQENAQQKKVCPNCGAEAAEGNEFCTSCGQKL